MSRNQPTAPPQCDDDVAGLFMKLGDGKGRPEYREFPEAALPPPAAVAPRAVHAATVEAVADARHAHDAASPAAQADTPLSQLFRRLAEAGAAVPDDSPLLRLRRQ